MKATAGSVAATRERRHSAEPSEHPEEAASTQVGRQASTDRAESAPGAAAPMAPREAAVVGLQLPVARVGMRTRPFQAARVGMWIRPVQAARAGTRTRPVRAEKDPVGLAQARSAAPWAEAGWAGAAAPRDCGD
jgi:hypothetical protein